MHVPRSVRSLAVLAAGLTGALAAAAPAGATEGPTGPPPPPWVLTPPTFQPAPTPPPAMPGTVVKARTAIRSARIVPRRVRRGKRATLRLSLSGAGRVQIVIKRLSRPHRGRLAVKRVSAGAAGTVAIRLPGRVHGRSLAAGRYRVSIVVVSSDGSRSRTVRRSFRVRAAHR